MNQRLRDAHHRQSNAVTTPRSIWLRYGFGLLRPQKDGGKTSSQSYAPSLSAAAE